MGESLPPTPTEAGAETSIFYDTTPRPLTRRQKLVAWLAGWLGAWLVALVGRTLRWEVVGQENWEAAARAGRPLIYAFWHRCLFSTTWYWRRRGIVLMTSLSADGEYLTRIIRAHGFGTARGSSSRGGLRAFAEMKRHLEAGRAVALTVDGPRGPRFVAKRGPVLLARRAGDLIVCFHIAPERAYVFRRSWDLFQVPYPFSRAAIFLAPAIQVPADADDSAQQAKQRELQDVLDRLRELGDDWWELSAEQREQVRADFRVGVLSAWPPTSTGGGPGRG